MGVDVVLYSAPNKNIDYPGLSMPALTAALRHRGYTVEQNDLNVALRDQLITAAGLDGLLSSSLPSYAAALCQSEDDLVRLRRVADFLRGLRDRDGFDAVEEVKKRAQERDYAWIFGSAERFQRLLAVFKLNRALHYLIDTAVTMSYYGDRDFLTCKVLAQIDKMRSDVLSKNPAIVGFSVLDIQRRFTLRAIAAIRSAFGGTIAVGGADPTRFPVEYIERCPGIDAVFYREADVSFPMFVEAREAGLGSRDEIPGIYWRDGQGQTRHSRQKILDLSEIPTPDFRGLPLHLYLTPALPIQASRGCFWAKCRFCIHWDTYCDFRPRDSEKVVDDLKALVSQHGARYFHFTDDCLPVPYARRLAKAMTRDGLDVRWLAYFRLESQLERNGLKELWDAGARVLEMGLESASERVLSLMRKNISVADADRIVREAAEIGLLVKLFMFHGFPGETADEAGATVRFTEGHILEGRIRPFLPLRNRFELLRGSDIYESTRGGQEDAIARYWLPSGLFAIRAEYELRDGEAAMRDLVAAFVERTRDYMRQNRIYSTDDENVMLDLITLDHDPMACGWRSH